MKKLYDSEVLTAAEPMLLGDYNKSRPWSAPLDGNPLSEGYLVSYGTSYGTYYETWMSKQLFERLYKPRETFDIGGAMYTINNKWFATREGWHKKGMFIFLFEGTKHNDVDYEDTIAFYNGYKYILGWSPSVSDVLATDWKRADVSMIPSVLLSMNK